MGVHSDTVPLICGVCLKVFPDVIQLSAHVKTTHWPLTNGDFSCDICGRPYSNKSKMSRHRKIHGLEGDTCDNNIINEMANESSKLDYNGSAEVELTCESCSDLRFSTLESLCNHRRTIHGLFPCDLCNKCYGRTSHLWKHVNRVHKGHADVTCPYCLKTSASKDHLAAHMAKIHRYIPEVKKDSENYITVKSNAEEGILHHCEKCNKGFHKRYLLRRHMKGCQNYRKDPGALLTRCRACERIFKDRASLQKHIENHHSTYTCHLCNETVVSKLGIMTHNRVKHMDHPDLTCDISSCKKLFRTKEDLESHRKDHKFHNNPNVCDFCGDTVENKLKLKMHVLSLHRNEIGVSCGVCLIPMKDPKDLKKHVETEHCSVLSNPNTCQVCGKQYASKWKAFDHTKKCHGKVFRTCKQCLAVFTNDNDIRDHYEHVHNVPKDQLAAFEYRMDISSKTEGFDTPDIIVKEEPDDLEFAQEMCDEYTRINYKRNRAPNDTYDCEICPEIFLNADTLSRHYQNVHNTDPARMLKKLNLDNSNSKRKMRNRKNFECKNCKKQFSTKSLFWNHINVCTRRSVLGRLDVPNNTSTSILESHLKNNNQIKREEPMLTNESNLNIPDFNLFEDINLQLSAQKPVPNLMPLPQAKSTGNTKCSRKDSRKVYDDSTNTECVCEVCGKQWPAKKHLWQHLIRFHRAEAAVTCGVCLKLCKTYQDLAQHLNAQHPQVLHPEGNNFTCKMCGRYHNARSKLLLHMGIHIDYVENSSCLKCKQSFANGEKLSEHAVNCNGILEFENHTTEDKDMKDDNDEKGSLIADETSVIEEAGDEEEDLESEGNNNAHENSNSEDNSENSDDSDSNSNSSSSDDDDEEEEGEEKEENETESNIVESRTNSRATGVSCNSESAESDSDDVEMDRMKNQNISDTDNFRIRDEGTQEQLFLGNNMENQRNDVTSVNATQNNSHESRNLNKFKVLNLEESVKISDEDSSDENDDDINNENDEVEEREDEEEEGEEEEEEDNEEQEQEEDNEEQEEEEEEEQEEQEDDYNDDGPPILSPMMPLLSANESEEHVNVMNRARHKLSPMISLHIDKDLDECEISEIQNGPENISSVSDPSNLFIASNNDLPITWSEEDIENNGDDDHDRDYDSIERNIGMMDKNVEFGKEYDKIVVNENDFVDEESINENMDEENTMDDSGSRDNQMDQMHDLNGTVLMVANDSEGNQILIDQNMLNIDNEDSNPETTQYIYPENAYEIEDYAMQGETDEIRAMYIQDSSENENSIENDVENDSDNMQK